MKADSLFKKMQKNKTQSAIVIDELGCVSGFVTMEDLIEEVMGNIDDEYDEPIELIKKIGDNIYLVDGTIPLHDLNRELSIHIRRESEQYSSLAGFIADKLEMIPEEGLEFELDNLRFKVIEVSHHRVKVVQIEILK